MDTLVAIRCSERSLDTRQLHPHDVVNLRGTCRRRRRLFINARGQMAVSKEPAVSQPRTLAILHPVRSRRAVLKLGLVAAVGAALPLTVIHETAAFRDRDCADFSTQRRAQRWFNRHGGSATHDPWNLDADNDGIACQNLP
jgi:hypothetical protein